MFKHPAKTFILTVAIASLSLTAVACNSQEENNEKQHKNHSTQSSNSHSQDQQGNADIKETTKNANQLPSFLQGIDPKIAQVYQIAAKNAPLLDSMPCYCGCGESVNHKSNRDCFIQQIKEDGAIVWDSHGTKCSTCLDIAVESSILKKQGKTDLEIRNFIDNKYKDFGKPTPTPMPA